MAQRVFPLVGLLLRPFPGLFLQACPQQGGLPLWDSPGALSGAGTRLIHQPFGLLHSAFGSAYGGLALLLRFLRLRLLFLHGLL